MKVALDSTPLIEPTGGIRRYTIELHRGLQAAFPLDEFRMISDQIPERPLGSLARRWWTIGLPQYLRRERIDLFHGTDFAVPYLPLCPSVMTVHDLSPWRNKAEISSRVRQRTPWMLRFGLATMVITPSEAIRREALEFFHLPPDEVVAIPLAASPHFYPTAGGSNIRVKQPYLLYVGTLEERKNIETLVSAWREVGSTYPIDLVLAGRARPQYPLPTSGNGLRLLGETPEEELPWLYSNASAVLYPSLYEGFGLPVLEAMQCGAAVIASRDPAISELSGDACMLVDATDVGAMTNAIKVLLTNSDLREEFRRRSLARARNYSWERTAKMTHAVYESALRRFHG